MRENNRQRKFSNALLQWYSRQGRILPWRNISDPYRILVSEIMLQQTQVSRVLVKYPAFLRRFPTLRSLARARQRDVVVAWRGMGYNNRAVRLHKFAQEVMNAHKGRIPGAAESLLSLPGIGRYTAHAILSSAFGKHVPVVDVNVRRVLSRIFWRMRSAPEMREDSEIWECARSLLPKAKAYTFNQALMDLGATICTARRPFCESCPVAEFCMSRSTVHRGKLGLRKPERSRDGIPNRIYRGRIVEELRGEEGSLSVAVLHKRVGGHLRSNSSPWFESLLVGLQKDGLIRIRGNGSAGGKRVSLA